MKDSFLKNWITTTFGIITIGIGIWRYCDSPDASLLEFMNFIGSGIGLMFAKDGTTNSLTEEQQKKIVEMINADPKFTENDVSKIREVIRRYA